MDMQNRNLKNNDLDQIAVALLKTVALQPADIDKIAEGRHLFKSVRARIRAEKDTAARDIDRSPGYVFSIPRAAMVSTAVFAAVALATFGVMSLREPGTGNQDVAHVPVVPNSEVSDLAGRTVFKPVLPRQESGPDRVQKLVSAEKANFQPAVVMGKAVPRTPPRRRTVQAADEPMEFYAIAGYSGSSDPAVDGRVVRVELPRASLLSLGVNVPLEGQSDVVKTDLLIGPDGVTRAIRLVE